MQATLLLFGLGLLGAVGVQGADVTLLRQGDALFSADFEGAGALKGWTGGAALAPGAEGGQAVAIEVPAGGRGATATHPIPVEPVRGCLLYVRAMVRAENVSEKPASWNGIKCMLIVENPAGRTYPQAPLGVGTFDWQRASFAVRVPKDATAMTLVLGLEQVSGKVWFDDVRITVAKPPIVVRPRPAGPIYKGHNLPRLRGAMISPNVDEASLRVLGREWNANLVRWQLIRTGAAARAASPEEYDRWLEGELKKLDAALPLCEKYGLYVVVDLHSPPGGKPTVSGYAGSDAGLFSDRTAQDHFVAVWQRITTRYKGARPIWGYDLANEPIQGVIEEGVDDWQDLAARAARAIREIDPECAIIVEPAQGGGPGGMSELVPLDVPNVVYSVHMYLPHAFTHQGVHGPSKDVSYPGVIEGKEWDKAQLERALQPAIEFQKNYGVHIYVGEFSAIRWAPDGSACRYLKDVIDIFEAHDWDWSYHAFREWSGWSVEYTSDRSDNQPAAQPTDRQKLLCSWYAKNKKPGW